MHRLILHLILLFLAQLTLPINAHFHSSHHSDREHQKRGAVSSLDARCSKVGTDVIVQGGNAADAAVATQLCLGVIGLYLTGIGGGGFLTVRSPNGSYEFVDFRETAPAASFQDMYNNNVNLSLIGGLASGVPGELRGLQYLHEHYGSKPWKELVQPAINFARFGFVVGQDLAARIPALGNDSLFLNAPWAEDFAPNGTIVKQGDTLTRKRYANTLEKIACEGAGAFYSGRIANATIAALKAQGGIMTVGDLKNYSIVSRAPVSIKYRNRFRLTSGPAPCGGIVALNILNTFNEFKDVGKPSLLNLTTHRLNEAMRFGYGARTDLGDPAFVTGMQAYENTLLTEQTAREIHSKISDARTQNISAYDPEGIESLETPGTSHLSTADASGMAVAMTSTINLSFGSRVMVPETGIIMNDEMNDFSIPGSSNAFGFIPSPVNFIAPGKRPLSSISPTIVEFLDNGRLYFVTGAAGGSRIITAVVQSIWNVLDRGMDTFEAVKEPRLHDQLEPETTFFEFAYNNATVAYLEAKGHNATFTARLSDLQVIRRHLNGTFEAASETNQLDSGGFAV